MPTFHQAALEVDYGQVSVAALAGLGCGLGLGIGLGLALGKSLHTAHTRFCVLSLVTAGEKSIQRGNIPNVSSNTFGIRVRFVWLSVKNELLAMVYEWRP